MQVSLIPRIYVVQPEYWEIEVVGSLPGIGLPALKAYPFGGHKRKERN
jgi:hypothetical protein